jgi:hypothetical protein
VSTQVDDAFASALLPSILKVTVTMEASNDATAGQNHDASAVRV